MSRHVKLVLQVSCYICNTTANATADFYCPSNPEDIYLPEGWDFYLPDIYDHEHEPRCNICVEKERAGIRKMEQQLAEEKELRRQKRLAKKAAKR